MSSAFPPCSPSSFYLPDPYPTSLLFLFLPTFAVLSLWDLVDHPIIRSSVLDCLSSDQWAGPS